MRKWAFCFIEGFLFCRTCILCAKVYIFSEINVIIWLLKNYKVVYWRYWRHLDFSAYTDYDDSRQIGVFAAF